MWRQPSPWPDTTELCLGEGPRRKSWLTGERAVNYAQKQRKKGLVSNVRTVLPLSGLVGDPLGASSDSRGHCRDQIPGETPQNWQDSGIIPVKIVP
jgi:hypothetical protein